MLKLKKVSKKARRFVVDIDDNRQQPDPFAVWFTPMSGVAYLRAQREYAKAQNLKVKVDAKTGDATVDVGEDEDELTWSETIIRQQVTAVEGILDSEDKRITESEPMLIALRDAPSTIYSRIVNQIAAKIQSESELSEDEEKKHDSQRPSSSADTSRSNGAAAGASHGTPQHASAEIRQSSGG